MAKVEIIRQLSTCPPYPKSGKFGTQKPTYYWDVFVDGRWMSSKTLLRQAKVVAKDYGTPTIVRP